LEQRIAEPQLPVYVHNLPAAELAAVLFAQVRSGDCRFKGLGRDGLFPGLPEKRLQERLEELELDFGSLLAHWDQVLPCLGDSFVAGAAAVDPLDGENTCRYCDYPMLCRILENRQQATEGNDE
ncbi:MAG: PD-(D/E)XK nuclease family protein, partial [Desulfuromonas sp.]